MKREALGVGGVRPTSRKAREVGHPRFCILQALKNERRYYSGAGEGGHPPKPFEIESKSYERRGRGIPPFERHERWGTRLVESNLRKGTKVGALVRIF
jgi:hypothetical protein